MSLSSKRRLLSENDRQMDSDGLPLRSGRSIKSRRRPSASDEHVDNNESGAENDRSKCRGATLRVKFPQKHSRSKSVTKLADGSPCIAKAGNSGTEMSNKSSEAEVDTFPPNTRSVVAAAATSASCGNAHLSKPDEDSCTPSQPIAAGLGPYWTRKRKHVRNPVSTTFSPESDRDFNATLSSGLCVKSPSSAVPIDETAEVDGGLDFAGGKEAATTSQDEKKQSCLVGDSIEPTRAKQSWDTEFVDLFFEALKEHGKDYVKLKQFIAQKTKNSSQAPQNVTQVRSFFYNTWIKLCKWLKMDQLTDVPREARELFTLINFGEWRKRTGIKKLNIVRASYRDNIKVLIYKGSARFKLKKKGKAARLIQIKTPFCGALKHFLPGYDDVEEMPSVNEVKVQLTPSRICDRDFILSRAQNPNVRLMLQPQKPFRSVLFYLERKWGLVEETSARIALGEESFSISKDLDGSDSAKSLDNLLTVFPKHEITTRPVRLRISQGSQIPLSFDEYMRRHRIAALDGDGFTRLESAKVAYDSSPERPKTGSSEPNFSDIAMTFLVDPATDCNNAEKDIHLSDVASDADDKSPDKHCEEQTDTAGITDRSGDGSVVIDPKRLVHGLSSQNAAGLTVGELFLMTRDHDSVKLIYEIHKATRGMRRNQAWNFFLTLLRSEMLESLPKKTTTPCSNNSERVINHVPPAASARDLGAKGDAPNVHVVDKPVADANKNAASFLQQLGSLQSSRRKNPKKVVIKKLNSSNQMVIDKDPPISKSTRESDNTMDAPSENRQGCSTSMVDYSKPCDPRPVQISYFPTTEITPLTSDHSFAQTMSYSESEMVFANQLNVNVDNMRYSGDLVGIDPLESCLVTPNDNHSAILDSHNFHELQPADVAANRHELEVSALPSGFDLSLSGNSSIIGFSTSPGSTTNLNRMLMGFGSVPAGLLATSFGHLGDGEETLLGLNENSCSVLNTPKKDPSTKSFM